MTKEGLITKEYSSLCFYPDIPMKISTIFVLQGENEFHLYQKAKTVYDNLNRYM